MVDTLLLTAVASVVVAALYVHVGRVVKSRHVSADAKLARDLFSWWWMMLGVLSLTSATQVVLYTSGHLPIWLYQTLGQVALLTLFTALWALQSYLVYLYRGSKRALVPLSLFYGVLYVGLIALIHWIGPPDQVVDDGWRLRTEPEFQLSRGIGILATLILLGPQMVAAIAYARLYRKTSDRTQRYRIAMLTGAILVWFGTSAVVGAASDPDDVNVPWQIAQRLLSVAAALTILMAYKPPAWVQRRYGVSAIDTGPPVGGSA